MKKMTFLTLPLLILLTISLQTAFAQDISFSPDGTTLASGSDDGTVKLWDVAAGTNIAILQGHTSRVYSVAFSPDGVTLASGSWDDTIKLWDVATHENIATLQRPLENWSLPMSFSPDGTTLASGAAGGTVKLWDVATHENIATLQGHLEDWFIPVSFSPDGTTLASGAAGGTVKLWDVATHENIATLEGHRHSVDSMSFSPDGTTLAAASGDVKLWDVATYENIATLQGHATSVLFSPDGTTLASGSDDGIIELWDVETHENITTLQGHGDYHPNFSFSALFSPDGTLLASWGGAGGEVELWDVATHENIATLHTGWVSYVAFSPDGKTLASGPGELWDVAEELRPRPNTLVKISGDDQQGTPGAALAHPLVVEVRDRDNNPVPDAQVTFTVTAGGGQLSGKSTVDVTTDANGRAAQTLTLSTKPGINSVGVSIGNELVTFNAVGISPYKLEIISGNFQQGKFNTALEESLVVEVRNRDNNPLPNVEVIFTVTYGNGRLSGRFTVEHVTTDANGRAERTFILGSDLVGNTVEVTIVGHEPVTFYAVGNSPSYITALAEHADGVRAVSFSPDGTLLASGGAEGFQEDGTVKLWDVETHTNIATLHGHTGPVFSVSFSPDGSTLASGSGDSTVKLWDVATKQNIATFNHAVGDVASVAFSPDGTQLASASLYFSFFDANLDDGTVELWDVATKQNIATLQVIATSVSFSPDGTLLASGTLDGTVELWDVATKQNIATLEGHTYWVWSVVFSPDGTTLASGALDEDATTKLWNVATRENIATLQTPGVSVAFSPDGTLLASASAMVGLWDARTGENIATLQGHTDLVYSMAFSPDGTTLASGSDDGTVKLWNMSEWMGPRPTPTDVRGPSVTKMFNVTDGEEADLEVLNRDGIIIEFDEDIAWSSLKLIYEGGTDLGWVSTVKDNKVTLTLIEGKELVHETSYVVSGTVRDGVGNETDLTLTFVAVKSLETTNDEPTPITDSRQAFESSAPSGYTRVTLSNSGDVWGVPAKYTTDSNVGKVTYMLLAKVKECDFATAALARQSKVYIKTQSLGHLNNYQSETVCRISSSTWSSSWNGVQITHLRFFDESSPSNINEAIYNSSTGQYELTSPPTGLKGDVNGDGIVNIQDLVLVASNLGKTGENAADVNGDGIVNIQDLVLVAGTLGSSAAAPSLNSESLSTLTAAEVKGWLTQAQQLNLTDITAQRGILFLEQLLVALTPKETVLLTNFPNPFNPETWIPYLLSKPADVTLTIYAINGQVVRRLALGHQPAGIYQTRSRSAYWDGRNEFGEPIASGIYFYTLTAGEFTATRKMLIRK